VHVRIIQHNYVLAMWRTNDGETHCRFCSFHKHNNNSRYKKCFYLFLYLITLGAPLTALWPHTTIVLPIYSIETCMHIIRSITNQTNLVSKIHFERDRISFFKQHVARLPLPPLKVNVQMYEYQRKIAPTIREKLCKQTLIMHILTYNIHQNAQDSPISCSL